MTWILPYPEVKFEYTNNRIYNSRALYYKGVNAAEDMYSRCIHADNNLYYVTSKTKYFLDVNKYQDLEYMYSQGLDLNTTFNYLSDSELEEISNEEILNSNDYDEIKAYYDNFDIKYRNNHWVQDTTSSIDEIMKNPGKVPFIDQQQKTKYYASPQTPMPKPNFVETNQILGR